MAFVRRYLSYLIAPALAAWTAQVVRAQDGTSALPIELRFTVFADGLLSGITFIPAPRQEPVTLRFLSTQRSTAYEYRGPNPLEFSATIRLPPDPARPGAPRQERVVVGRAVIPPNVREAFLLFSVEPGWENQPVPRYVVQVFDDSRAYAPLDHIIFLNATGLPLFGTLADREIQLPLGLSRPVRMQPGETPVILHVLHEGSPLPVYGDRIALERNQRVLVVLFPPGNPESTHVRRRLLYDPARLPNFKPPPEGSRG